MNIRLLHPDGDVGRTREVPPHAADLAQDLGLETLWETMAGGDAFLAEVARSVMLASLTDPEAITYRQRVLRDCLAHPAVVRQLYTVALEAITGERKVYRSAFFRYPAGILHGALEVMQLFLRQLRQLRAIADAHADAFASEGFRDLFATLQRDLSEDYLRQVEAHLRQLQFRHGVLLSARLGPGNKGRDYTLCRLPPDRRGWRRWLPGFDRAAAYTVVVPDRDESGLRALSDLRDQGLNLAANALAQSADHILGFFTTLREALGFYLGCLTLWERLVAKGEPVCFPEPLPPGRHRFSCRGLYDVALSLRLERRVVGNDVDADDVALVVITGANQGGKSTFLRSVGLAHLMLQCGMFVGAGTFRASLCEGLFTHYRREEDPTLQRGKWEEELDRMRTIVERLTPRSLVLFNEAFAATNEREGAEIAGGIVRALVEAGVRVFYVTHSYELAHRFTRERPDGVLFLRAHREPDGRRTFRLVPGEPLPTSYGEDLYRQIFGEVDAVAPTGAGGR